MLEELIQLAHSYNGVVSLWHECRLKIQPIYPIHPNSMPPHFGWIPAIFPHNFKVMPEVNQYFTLILLDSHVEGVFPFALSQNPHASAACCFLFALCRHTDVLFSPILLYSQGCWPIRGQCGQIYFSYPSLHMPAHACRAGETCLECQKVWETCLWCHSLGMLVECQSSNQLWYYFSSSHGKHAWNASA